MRADLDPRVRVIALAGNGSGFCGGYDLVASAEAMGRLGLDETPEGSQAADSGFKQAVRERDEPFGDFGRGSFKG